MIFLKWVEFAGFIPNFDPEMAFEADGNSHVAESAMHSSINHNLMKILDQKQIQQKIKRLAIDPVVLQGVRFPPEIIYLNRVNLANYFLMRRLGVRANFHQLLIKYVPPDREL